ncbi:MAG: efflux RND transporter periplasmic adaptor subunit [Vicinamibacterales bacterium]
MSWGIVRSVVTALVAVSSLVGVACGGSAETKAKEQTTALAAVSVSPVAAVEQPIARFIRVAGSLTAEEQADVAAETAGRVIATPVERGTRVTEGSELVRLSAVETEASLAEAQANAAQIEARLALTPAGPFDVSNVPEVRNAQANLNLAQAEFARIEKLLAERVVSQAEYDQRKTTVEAARQQLESARNAAQQQYQALQGARARVTLASKAVADTSVRAPFTGIVGQRMVSTGDYVTKGTKIAEVVRITPLRVQLTVPEQFVSEVAVGQPMSLAVDAYPGRRFTGTVRYVSPALRADQRALTVEAVVPNERAELKPGMFATAEIQQANKTTGVLVPASAVQTLGGTGRVFVVTGDRVEERIVTTGQAVPPLIEIINGLKAGEQVATTNINQLVDGSKVRN